MMGFIYVLITIAWLLSLISGNVTNAMLWAMLALVLYEIER
jgi:hypothetical protein